MNTPRDWQVTEVRKVLEAKRIDLERYRLTMTNTVDFHESRLRDPHGLIVELRQLLKDATARKWLEIKAILESSSRNEWLKKRGMFDA